MLALPRDLRNTKQILAEICPNWIINLLLKPFGAGTKSWEHLEKRSGWSPYPEDKERHLEGTQGGYEVAVSEQRQGGCASERLNPSTNGIESPPPPGRCYFSSNVFSTIDKMKLAMCLSYFYWSIIQGYTVSQQVVCKLTMCRNRTWVVGRCMYFNAGSLATKIDALPNLSFARLAYPRQAFEQTRHLLFLEQATTIHVLFHMSIRSTVHSVHLIVVLTSWSTNPFPPCSRRVSESPHSLTCCES